MAVFVRQRSERVTKLKHRTTFGRNHGYRRRSIRSGSFLADERVVPTDRSHRPGHPHSPCRCDRRRPCVVPSSWCSTFSTKRWRQTLACARSSHAHCIVEERAVSAESLPHIRVSQHTTPEYERNDLRAIRVACELRNDRNRGSQPRILVARFDRLVRTFGGGAGRVYTSLRGRTNSSCSPIVEGLNDGDR